MEWGAVSSRFSIYSVIQNCLWRRGLFWHWMVIFFKCTSGHQQWSQSRQEPYSVRTHEWNFHAALHCMCAGYLSLFISAPEQVRNGHSVVSVNIWYNMDRALSSSAQSQLMFINTRNSCVNVFVCVCIGIKGFPSALFSGQEISGWYRKLYTMAWCLPPKINLCPC